MRNIPVLGIPFLNRVDLLLRCIDSIDYPVDKLVIVNNGPERSPLNLEEGQWSRNVASIINITQPNTGVAASWNQIIKNFPADYWMLVNNDIRFAPGDLERMASEPQRRGDAEKDNIACYYGNHGASFWAVTRQGVEVVGLFDENLFPAYLEDCDWSRRADLMGMARVNVPGIQSEHGYGAVTGSCTIMSDPKVRENNHRTHGGNFEYYRRKWGGNNGEEVFNHPFNNPAIPMWAWRFEPGFRQSQLSKIL